MKKAKRWLAALLIVLILPIQALAVTAAPAAIANEIEAAVYFAALMERGEYSCYIKTPGGFNMDKMYSYCRMLFPESYAFSYTTGDNLVFSISVQMTASLDKYNQAVAAAKKVVAQHITQDMTEREKLLTLRDYLCEKTEYDYAAAQNINKAPKEAFSAYGALIKGKAVCDGYSAAFAVMCRAAGIPCIYVDSTAMGHSWNAVLFEGGVRHIDATFEDTGKIDGALGEDYFLVTDKQLQKLGHKVESERVKLVTDRVWDKWRRAAYQMTALGLMKGSNKGLELERVPNRGEAMIMLTRLTGKEAYAAVDRGDYMPFTDVNAFNRPYIAYCYMMGYTSGKTAALFGPGDATTCTQFMTFILRALGYSDNLGDFMWNDSISAAVRYGIISKQDAADIEAMPFNRGVMAFLNVCALRAAMKSGEKLADRLVALGAISQAKLDEIMK